MFCICAGARNKTWTINIFSVTPWIDCSICVGNKLNTPRKECKFLRQQYLLLDSATARAVKSKRFKRLRLRLGDPTSQPFRRHVSPVSLKSCEAWNSSHSRSRQHFIDSDSIQILFANSDPETWAETFESFERINSIHVTNGNLDSCSPCKRLVLSLLHVLH